jgi:hypothetical protein
MSSSGSTNTGDFTAADLAVDSSTWPTRRYVEPSRRSAHPSAAARRASLSSTRHRRDAVPALHPADGAGANIGVTAALTMACGPTRVRRSLWPVLVRAICKALKWGAVIASRPRATLQESMPSKPVLQNERLGSTPAFLAGGKMSAHLGGPDE